MNASKIVVPKQVADAIAHYVALADSKTEALTDILRFGYEAANSEIILRHFEHDYDELMEALICGYEVEKTPEEKVAEYYADSAKLYRDSAFEDDRRFYLGKMLGVKSTLDKLGIRIEWVND